MGNATILTGSHRPNIRAVVELLSGQRGTTWRSFENWGTIDDCYSVLFDELELDKGAQHAVGVALTEGELGSARELVAALEALYLEIPLRSDSSLALRAPGWPRVSSAARAMLAAMGHGPP